MTRTAVTVYLTLTAMTSINAPATRIGPAKTAQSTKDPATANATAASVRPNTTANTASHIPHSTTSDSAYARRTGLGRTVRPTWVSVMRNAIMIYATGRLLATARNVFKIRLGISMDIASAITYGPEMRVRCT
jgi:hypothetical protein